MHPSFFPDSADGVYRKQVHSQKPSEVIKKRLLLLM